MRQHEPSGLHKERRMSDKSWNVLKIASIVITVVGVVALVIAIVMGHSGAQGY